MFMINCIVRNKFTACFSVVNKKTHWNRKCSFFPQNFSPRVFNFLFFFAYAHCTMMKLSWQTSYCLHLCEWVKCNLNTWNASIQLNFVWIYAQTHTKQHLKHATDPLTHSQWQYRQYSRKPQTSKLNWNKNTKKKKTFYKWLPSCSCAFFIHSLVRSL